MKCNRLGIRITLEWDLIEISKPFDLSVMINEIHKYVFFFLVYSVSEAKLTSLQEILNISKSG